MKIVRHKTAKRFLDRTEAWLMQEEAVHNLLLGLADNLRQHTRQVRGDRDPAL